VPNDTRDFSQMLEKNQSDDKGPKTLSVLKEISDIPVLAAKILCHL
jgi:hypothetical protein